MYHEKNAWISIFCAPKWIYLLIPFPTNFLMYPCIHHVWSICSSVNGHFIVSTLWLFWIMQLWRPAYSVCLSLCFLGQLVRFERVQIDSQSYWQLRWIAKPRKQAQHLLNHFVQHQLPEDVKQMSSSNRREVQSLWISYMWNQNPLTGCEQSLTHPLC